MSKLELVETSRSFTDGRYEIHVTEWESLDGERKTAVTVKDEGREIFHTGSAVLENFELETVEKYLRGTIELRDALTEYARRKREK